MNNSITVSITFSFKGETFSPSVKIDLDAMMARGYNFVAGSELVTIYPRLAADIDIDIYSYAYEIMQAGEPVYLEPSGLAKKHLIESKFDYQAFCDDWFYHKNLLSIQKIAKSHLGVTDLEQQPDLRDALMEALEAGKKIR